jgi:hypothetical protein
VEAWGSLGVELKLGRSTWHVVDVGNAVAPLPARSAPRRGLGITRRGVEARPRGVVPWSTRETWSLLACPECSTSRPGDRSTGS